MASEAIGAAALDAAGGSGAARTIRFDGSAGAAGGNSEALQVKFAQAMDKAGAPAPAASASEIPAPIRGMFTALDNVNVQAKSVADYAATAEASGGELTPGEIVQLTMKCQEFMFQCQLTSNIANRSSDGVQQLFRQQS